MELNSDRDVRKASPKGVQNREQWDNDHHYMSRLFAFAMKHQIGLGGPIEEPFFSN